MKHFLHLLGVNDDASWVQIREGYIRQVKVWHPDRYIDDPSLHHKAEERTKEIHYALRRLEELKTDIADSFNPDTPFLEQYYTATDGGKGAHGKVTFEDRRMGYNAQSFGNWSAVKNSLSDSMHRGAKVIKTAIHSAPKAARKKSVVIKVPKSRRPFSSVPLFLIGFGCTLVLSSVGAYNLLQVLPDQNQMSPDKELELAARRELVQMLLKEPQAPEEKNLDERARLRLVNERTSEERADIIQAAMACNKSKVESLLRQGAKMEAQDSLGHTALIWAAKKNCAPVVQLLVSRGANTQMRTTNGFTALRWAQWYRHNNTIQTLAKLKVKN